MRTVGSGCGRFAAGQASDHRDSKNNFHGKLTLGNGSRRRGVIFALVSGTAAEHRIWFKLLRAILSLIRISSVGRGERPSTVLVTRVRRDITSKWDSPSLDYRMRK